MAHLYNDPEFKPSRFGGDQVLAVAPATPARPRPGGGRPFILIGVIVAVLGAGGLFFVSSALGGGGGAGGGPTTKVVVAAGNIPLRHQMVASDLVLAPVSGATVNTFTKVTDVVNLITQISITKGEIITADMLAKTPDLVTGTAIQYLPLPTGYVGLTIPTGEQVGVAGHIAVGDYITMIASGNSSIFQTSPSGGGGAPAAPKFIVKTIFTQLHVIGLGPALAPQPAANGASSSSTTGAQTVGITSSLTVAVTQCQAEYITWFQTNMTLKYTLESYNDYLKVQPTAASLSCPTVDSTKGVTNATIDSVFHFSSVS